SSATLRLAGTRRLAEQRRGEGLLLAEEGGHLALRPPLGAQPLAALLEFALARLERLLRPRRRQRRTGSHQRGPLRVLRVGGDVAQGAVVEGQQVALGAEGVVGGAHRRGDVLAGRRPRNAARRGRRAEPPDVEIAAAVAERLVREQRRDQLAGIGGKRPLALGGRVTIA